MDLCTCQLIIFETRNTEEVLEEVSNTNIKTIKKRHNRYPGALFLFTLQKSKESTYDKVKYLHILKHSEDSAVIRIYGNKKFQIFSSSHSKMFYKTGVLENLTNTYATGFF